MSFFRKSVSAVNNYALFIQRFNYSCSRGNLGRAARNLDPSDPQSWEFSAFSQNGEDGIIEQLTGLIREPNRYFFEIGAADGLENNTAYLALVKKQSGLAVEGSRWRSRYAQAFVKPHCLGVTFLNEYVTPSTTSSIISRLPNRDPDFFSLDIDGMDYHVLNGALEAGLRPKVICVEYNSAFGPDQSVTLPFQETFDNREAHSTGLYYGVSLAGWQNMLRARGYEFVAVESNGVNAFFADPEAVEIPEIRDLERLKWRENVSQFASFGGDWQKQFPLIKDQALIEIPSP